MPQHRLHDSHAARQAAYRRRQRLARQAELQAKGLPALPAIPTMPGTARWTRAVDHARDLLTGVADEMEDYYEDRSDEWKEDCKGDDHKDRLRTIRRVAASLEGMLF